MILIKSSKLLYTLIFKCSILFCLHLKSQQSEYILVGHVFLQQPYHPTYFALERLDQCMTNTYSQANCPNIPQPVLLNSVCAAPCDEGKAELAQRCLISSLTDWYVQVGTDVKLSPMTRTQRCVISSTWTTGATTVSVSTVSGRSELTSSHFLSRLVVHTFVYVQK